MVATLDLTDTQLSQETDRKTIKDYVLTDFRTATIFEKYGLDFCCGGGKTVLEACQKLGIQYDDVKLELENLERFGKGEGAVSRFNEWSITFLSDYIVQNHHLYVRKMIPVILMHADKVARVHAERWPYMIQVAELFAEIASELGSHMYKEEAILFPRLKQLEASLAAVGTAASLSSPLQLSAPITQMMSEHDVAGDIMARIRTLTDHYVLPEGGCNTFRTLLSELHDFELDLHQHVFLENNILFPKALLIEEAAQKRSFI